LSVTSGGFFINAGATTLSGTTTEISGILKLTSIDKGASVYTGPCATGASGGDAAAGTKYQIFFNYCTPVSGTLTVSYSAGSATIAWGTPYLVFS
jgi:hypothetical protein